MGVWRDIAGPVISMFLRSTNIEIMGTFHAQHERWRSRPISRVLSWTVIPLGASSPIRSSNLPGDTAGRGIASLFGLAPGGVCRAGLLPGSRCALTAPFHPCLPDCSDIGGIFLLHFPSARAAQALPGTVPCGARTFLGIDCSMTRLPGRLRHAHCRTCAFSHRRPARFRPRTGPLGRSFVARIRPDAASGGSHAKPRMRCAYPGYRSGWLTSTVSPSNRPSGPKRRSWMLAWPSWPTRMIVPARVP